jgi:hypothetical protein
VNFDRERVRGWIEEALDVSLGLNDSSADTLIAQAQELGLSPDQLRLWIYDQPKLNWTPGALAEWARHVGLSDTGGLQRAVPPEIPDEPEETEA